MLIFWIILPISLKTGMVVVWKGACVTVPCALRIFNRQDFHTKKSKSADICDFSHIYKRNSCWKIVFFVQCKTVRTMELPRFTYVLLMFFNACKLQIIDKKHLKLRSHPFGTPITNLRLIPHTSLRILGKTQTCFSLFPDF